MSGLRIGDATVLLSAEERVSPWSVDRLHRPFFHLGGSPTLTLLIQPLGAFCPRDGNLGYDSGLAWRVWEMPESFCVVFQGRDRSGPLKVCQALTADRAWRSGTLYLPAFRKSSVSRLFPLSYPLEQLLFVSILAHSAGAVVHGTGVILDGQGFVFAGTHGAGKSTLAALLRRQRGVTLLNDERVVARCLDGEWRVFGTPWAGTVRQVSSESAPLGGIFFIRHDPATHALAISPSQATSRLLARCFHPYWDREGLKALIGTVGRLVREVPCYDFPFAPRPEPVLAALDSVRNL